MWKDVLNTKHSMCRRLAFIYMCTCMNTGRGYNIKCLPLSYTSLTGSFPFRPVDQPTLTMLLSLLFKFQACTPIYTS